MDTRSRAANKTITKNTPNVKPKQGRKIRHALRDDLSDEEYDKDDKHTKIFEYYKKQTITNRRKLRNRYTKQTFCTGAKTINSNKSNTAKQKPKQERKIQHSLRDDLSDEEFDKGDDQIKILEHYINYKKNKKKYKKTKGVWATLAEDIDLTADQCASRFKNLKKVYLQYIQKDCANPDIPIRWPYYDLCKKVFGYKSIMRIMKSRIMKHKRFLQKDEWTSKEIETIIEHYSKYFEEISKDPNDLTPWSDIAETLKRSKESIRDKLLDLQRSYEETKSKLKENPDCEITWTYFKLFDEAHRHEEDEKLKVESLDDSMMQELPTITEASKSNMKQELTTITKVSESNMDQELTTITEASESNMKQELTTITEVSESNMKQELPTITEASESNIKQELTTITEASESNMNQEFLLDTELSENKVKSEDIQCIIVVSEEDGIASNTQIIPKSHNKEPQRLPLWTNKEKLNLLNLYYEYIKNNRDKVINTREMWKDIASKMTNRTPFGCKSVVLKLDYKYERKLKENISSEENRSKFSSKCEHTLSKIKELKPEFTLPPFSVDDLELNDKRTFTDVTMPLWKLEVALKYYLKHIEEFIDPKYDKNHAWSNLAKCASYNAQKLFRKINYIKQFYDSETNKVNGEKVTYGKILKKIIEKELICKIAIEESTINQQITDEVYLEELWSEEEVEFLE